MITIERRYRSDAERQIHLTMATSQPKCHRKIVAVEQLFQHIAQIILGIRAIAHLAKHHPPHMFKLGGIAQMG